MFHITQLSGSPFRHIRSHFLNMMLDFKARLFNIKNSWAAIDGTRPLQQSCRSLLCPMGGFRMQKNGGKVAPRNYDSKMDIQEQVIISQRSSNGGCQGNFQGHVKKGNGQQFFILDVSWRYPCYKMCGGIGGSCQRKKISVFCSVKYYFNNPLYNLHEISENFQ